jgi:hypothetical protein
MVQVYRVRDSIIALMMEEQVPLKRLSFYQTTRRNNPEDSHLHTRRRENLKSQNVKKILVA